LLELDKGQYYGEVSEKVNLTFGGLPITDALLVTKTVRRSFSSEFLVWDCITMSVLLEDNI